MNLYKPFFIRTFALAIRKEWSPILNVSVLFHRDEEIAASRQVEFLRIYGVW